MDYEGINFDSVKKIWYGKKTLREYDSNRSIGKVVMEKFSQNPETISQICHPSGRQYTNQEVAKLSMKFAKHFKKLGFEQCDMVGFCASNTEFVAPLFFGSMLMGLTFSTLDYSFDKDGIMHIFGINKPKIMFCDGGNYERVKAAFEELKLNATIYTMRDHIAGVPNVKEFFDETDDEDFQIEPLKMGPSQTAAILCSSGTTGLPKGVCMSHEGLLRAKFSLEPNQRLLCFSSLHWLSGLFNLLHTALNGATRVISAEGFSPENFFHIMETYQVNSMLSPPSQLALIVASPAVKAAKLNSFKNYYCSGSAVAFALVQKLKNYFPLINFYTGYGASELLGLITLGEATPERGYVGTLVENLEMKVIDENGHSLGPNQEGEFCARTPYPWAGYYNNEAGTAEIRKENGWLHTGDLGYIDKNGAVYILDRKKDILKFNNYHYFPTEIEQVILELDGIANVCVVGLPDLTYTHLPAAAVVKKFDSTLSENDVYEHVARRMTHFKHLRGGVYFLDELPLTVTGKIRRKDVTNLCEKLRNLKSEREI